MSGPGSSQLTNQEAITHSCWPQLSHLAGISAGENLAHIIHLYIKCNNAAVQESVQMDNFKATLPKTWIMNNWV